MKLLKRLWAAAEESRKFCFYCEDVPVSKPGAYCSEQCESRDRMEMRSP